MPGPHQNSLHITQLNYAFHFLPELWLIHVAYNALNDLTFDLHSSFMLLNSSLLTCPRPLRASLWSLNTPSLSLSLNPCLCLNCPRFSLPPHGWEPSHLSRLVQTFRTQAYPYHQPCQSLEHHAQSTV